VASASVDKKFQKMPSHTTARPSLLEINRHIVDHRSLSDIQQVTWTPAGSKYLASPFGSPIYRSWPRYRRSPVGDSPLAHRVPLSWIAHRNRCCLPRSSIHGPHDNRLARYKGGAPSMAPLTTFAQRLPNSALQRGCRADRDYLNKPRDLSVARGLPLRTIRLGCKILK
jgi:hypothetical protein